MYDLSLLACNMESSSSPGALGNIKSSSTLADRGVAGPGEAVLEPEDNAGWSSETEEDGPTDGKWRLLFKE